MSKADPALTALDSQLAAQNQDNKNKKKTFIIYDDQENNIYRLVLLVFIAYIK